MAVTMMTALLPSKLPTASEVQRQVAAARQKAKSLPSILRSPPRASPQEAAAPRQQQRPVETRALLPRAAAPARSEFCGPDRALVLLREDALAPIATRVVFKPADPAQQRFVTAQHNQVRNFLGHHFRAVVSDDDAMAQQCREAFQRRRRGLTKSASEPPRKAPKHLPELTETPLRPRVATVQPMPFGPPVVPLKRTSLLHLDHSTSPSVISPPLPASPPPPASPPLPGPSPLAPISVPPVSLESSSSREASPTDLMASSLGHGVQGAALVVEGQSPLKSKTSNNGSFAAAASVEGGAQLLPANDDVANLATRIVDTEIDGAVGNAEDLRENAAPLRTDDPASATEAQQPLVPLVVVTARRSPVPSPSSADGPSYWQGHAVSEWGLPQADRDAVPGEGPPESNDADAILGATESLPPRKATAGIGEPRKGFDGKVQDISGWGPGP